MSYVIKTAVKDQRARTFAFPRSKTMYGGKAIAAGDTVYVFASETSGGGGLIAMGVVTKAAAHAKPKDVERWTPRVSIEIRVTARAKARLGRDELKAWRGVTDGSAEAELDFKLYRQATDKIVGISDAAAKFLARRF
jgi:hypothetical protein